MSYGALAGRLAANPWGDGALKDFSGPVIRLESLSPEELWLLLHNIRNVFALGDPQKYLIPDEGIEAFIRRCAETLGAKFYQTPRDAAKAFTGLLSVLEQNPGADWRRILGGAPIEKGEGDPDDPVASAAPDGDELVGFTLK
jgi:hypothetical protein